MSFCYITLYNALFMLYNIALYNMTHLYRVHIARIDEQSGSDSSDNDTSSSESEDSSSSSESSSSESESEADAEINVNISRVKKSEERADPKGTA